MTLAAIVVLSAFLGSAAGTGVQVRPAYSQDVQPPVEPSPNQTQDKPAPQNPPESSPPQPDQQPSTPSPSNEQNAAKPEPQEKPAGSAAEPTTQPGETSVSGPTEQGKEQPTLSKKSKNKSKHKKKSAATQNPGDPARKVVRNGSTHDPEVDFAPTVTGAQASKQRQDTEHLLQLAEANVKQASARPLTVAQEDTVGQIKLYMDQSKRATDAGDWQRAHNLAFKAQLLSSELTRQQP
jgi:hypothetical protein